MLKNYVKLPWQVMSVKALGIALKLTLSGTNQLIYPQTWVFVMIVLSCVLTQMNYLNKVFSSISSGDIFTSMALILLLDDIVLFGLLYYVSPFSYIPTILNAGSGHIQYCCCLTNLLCHVHIINDRGQRDHVQGNHTAA